MSDQQTWDVSISKSTNQHGAVQLRILFPSALAKALVAAEMNRATIQITEDGILVVPYVGQASSVSLPEWGKK